MTATFSKMNNLVTLCFFFGIVSLVHGFKLSERKNIKSIEPSWVPLCDKGHSYLFSDADDLEFGLADWTNAKWKCASLGGYLVKIENRHENNCILVQAQKQGLHHYWWTSGIP